MVDIMKVAIVAWLSLTCLWSCSRRPQEEHVVVYVSVDQIYAEPILNTFSDKTGIRVLPLYDVEANKTVGLANRLRAEKNRPQADVFWNGEFIQTLQLNQEGLLDGYFSPSAQDLPEPLKDPEGRWTAFGGRARVLLVHSGRVPENQSPTSIQDFLDPRWSAQDVGIALPIFGTTATHAAALYAVWGAEAGKAFFQKIRDRKVRIVDGNAVVRDRVASGELLFGLTDTDDALGAVRDGAPVDMVIPDQDDLGTLVIPQTVAILQKAPHPVQARALVDYLLSDEVEKRMVESGFCQIPARPKNASAGGHSFASIKVLNVGFEDILQQLPTAQRDLKEIFLR